jgi:hypothetical protein
MAGQQQQPQGQDDWTTTRTGPVGDAEMVRDRQGNNGERETTTMNNSERETTTMNNGERQTHQVHPTMGNDPVS